jgi:hypothetical protein
MTNDLTCDLTVADVAGCIGIDHGESSLSLIVEGTVSTGSDVPRFRVPHALQILIRLRSPADNLLQDCRVPVTMD